MPENMTVTVTPTTLRVDAGETTEAAITIGNTSNIVDVFAVEIRSIDPEWANLSTASTSLFPGDGDTITLKVALPRGSATTAGTLPVLREGDFAEGRDPGLPRGLQPRGGRSVRRRWMGCPNC